MQRCLFFYPHFTKHGIPHSKHEEPVTSTSFLPNNKVSLSMILTSSEKTKCNIREHDQRN